MNDVRFRLFYVASAMLAVCFLGGCASSYKKAEQAKIFKRYYQMADLKEDADLIGRYKKELESEQWKRVCEIFREQGVLDYEIYLFRNRLLGILETDLDFDVRDFAEETCRMDDVKRWMERTEKYFKTIDGFEDCRRWVLTDRVYKLEQKKEYDKNDGYIVKGADVRVRRICDARELVDEPEQIAKYIELHAMGKAWPEITQGMKDAGIIDLEICLAGNRTFEITEVGVDADLDEVWAKIDNGPRSAEWGALVGPIDKRFVDENGKPLENQLMERIFKLN